ncbi:hypothetical protein L9F63_017837, partial [Diploptera punctata]
DSRQPRNRQPSKGKEPQQKSSGPPASSGKFSDGVEKTRVNQERLDSKVKRVQNTMKGFQGANFGRKRGKKGSENTYKRCKKESIRVRRVEEKAQKHKKVGKKGRNV